MTIFDNFTISTSYMSMIMSETHISIDYAKYNELISVITSTGQACMLNNSVSDLLGNTSKTSSGAKLATFLDDLCKSSNTHSIHVSESLTTFLVKLKEEYEKLDKASSETLKLE